MPFEKSQMVQLKADPSRMGPVIEILPPVDGLARYLVFHTAGNVQEYYENQLEPAAEPSTITETVAALQNGELSSADEFRARITAERLSNPQADSLYSLHAARIQFIPFQFKPLLRFLRADRPRLLIADEVGVGKTIEAGLIFREMQARQGVGNVMIVCPKALVFKWQTEMNRFDERFHALSPQNLRYCIKETHLNGKWPAQYARAIVSLETLRMAEYLEGNGNEGKSRKRRKPVLLSLDPPPQFDLVVFDEAHHLRNRETNSHEAARFLCDVSEAVLLLSATPVHLGSEDLFSLLNLLRPELLPDTATFQQMAEPNAHIIQAMHHIRTCTPVDTWQDECLSSIRNAVDTEWGRQALRDDPRITDWANRLSSQPGLDDEERIRALRDLEEVQTFAYLMNRTRRRDIESFTIREPHTVKVDFTHEQMTFYKELVRFRERVLLLKHDPRTVRMVTVSLERQASSCLPALIPMLDSFVRTGRFRTEDHSDYSDNLEDEIALNLPASLVEDARGLQVMAANLSPEDPKLERLRELAYTVLENSRPQKVLVFSYFLHTLDYLHDNLSDGTIRIAKITGKTDDADREDLRRRFRLPYDDDDAIDILLSSEVGCEGLDYEFCDCLVNYDIPWNPMRIEQRIGRIDRFGQKSKKVLIYNFITPGTVEERIHFRCFERLGVFRNTVGDLEDILGDVTKKLDRIVYDSTLSPVQAERQAKQTADNAIRKAEELRRLEGDSEALLGLEQSFIQEVDSLIDAGRYVSPVDLAHMIKLYVEQDAIGGGITPTRTSKQHRLRLNEGARANVLRHVNALNSYDRATLDFKRWLEGSEPYLTLTYDRETALEQRELPFITPIHPLAKVAKDHWQAALKPLVASLMVKESKIIPGRYFFAVALWKTLGVRPEVQLKTFFWDIDRHEISAELSSLLPLLGEARDWQNINRTAGVDLQECLNAVDEYANKMRLQQVEQLKIRNDNLLEQQLASLRLYNENRLTGVRRELAESTNERISRMKRAELNRIEWEYDQRHREIEWKRNCDILASRIAIGLVIVEPE